MRGGDWEVDEYEKLLSILLLLSIRISYRQISKVRVPPRISFFV